MARTCLTATTPVLTVEPQWTGIDMSREGIETCGTHPHCGSIKFTGDSWFLLRDQLS